MGPIPPFQLAAGPAVSSAGPSTSGGFSTFGNVTFGDDPINKWALPLAVGLGVLGLYLWKK